MKSFLPDYFPYAARLALSAWISFAIAASLHVENAFWAAMPVWVIAQSTRGLLLERAIYRIIGTLIGAVFSIGLLHLSLHPVILIICLGLWAAACSAGTHMIRGVRSYGILMAGITASVVILPTLLNLEVTSEYAYARVECTLIGVIISTMIMGTITPKSSLPDFYQRIIQLSQDVMQYAEHMLNYGKDQQIKRQAEKIMNDISEVDDAALDASAGSITGYRRLQYVDIFISSSLAVMASSLALHRRQQQGETVSEEIKALLTPEAVSEFDLKKHPLPARKTLLRATPNQRLKNALTVLIGIQKILTDKTNDSPNQLTVSEKLRYLAPYRNWKKAISTGLLTGCTTIFVGCCVLFTGIQEIALAALAISMITMLISTSPVPKKGASLILISVTLGILMAIYYRLFLQPHITNWLELVITIIPFILVGAVARANKKTSVPALDANMCFLLGSQAGAATQLAPSYVLLESGALWAGAFIVTILYILAPQNMKRSSEYWKDRILEDISALLTSKSHRHWHGTAARHILRLIQDLRRASLLDNVSVGILDALNLGYTIDKLRAIPVSRQTANQEAQQVLTLLANFTVKPAHNATQIEALLPNLTSTEVRILAQDIVASLTNGHAFLQISHA